MPTKIWATRYSELWQWLFDLRIDGSVEEGAFKTKEQEYKEQLIEIKAQLDNNKGINQERIEDACRTFELSNRLYPLYVKGNYEEKAKIAKYIASNYTLNNLTLYPAYKKPFSFFAKGLTRPIWLPAFDARRTTTELQEVVLIMKLFTRRKRGNLLSLDQPFPQEPAHPKRIYENTIYEGLKLQSFIKNSPTRMTWAKASQELQISDSKIAHLLKIVNNLPPDFIETMKSCANEETLKIFNGRKLLWISRLKTEKERRNELERLLPKA